MAKNLPDVDPFVFLPLRYEDRRHRVPMSRFEDGVTVLATGKILAMGISIGEKGRVLTASIEDEGGGDFRLVFFHCTRRQETILGHRGMRITLWGKPKRAGDGWVFYHPELLPENTGCILPIYRCPRGISEGRLRNHVWKKVQKCVAVLSSEAASALRQIHHPVDSIPGPDVFKRLTGLPKPDLSSALSPKM